jgi:transglutaminase-like putative cysteine protease
LVVLLAAAPAKAAPEAGRLVEEVWESAALDGAKVGFVHTTVRALDADATRLRATAELELNFRRRGAAVRLRMEHGTEEGADGKVLGVFMRQYHDRDRQLVLTGVADGKVLHVKVDGGRIERRLPWNEDAVGLRGLEHLFEKRKPRTGDTFAFRRYEPTFNTMVTVRVEVKGREAVPLPAGRKELLRVELVPEKIVVPGHSVQPPREVWWLDADFVPRRRQRDLEGLGTLTLTRTTRELARAPGTGPARAPDLGLTTLIPLNRAIPQVSSARSVLYRVTVRGDSEAGSAFCRDAHQEVRDVKGSRFELLVHPVRPAGAGERAEEKKPGAEYLASCHYLDSDDERVRALARRAAGDEKDPWRKALCIERWVHAAMRTDHAAPTVPAGQVARSLRGDCRAYAFLTAALCRAEGLPSRTAIGLVYVERGGRPYLGFHMWAEVWVAGRWLGLDATLGRGGVGAGHLKITAHSWNETPSLTPLLPVTRVLGKLAVEVLRVEAGG